MEHLRQISKSRHNNRLVINEDGPQLFFADADLIENTMNKMLARHAQAGSPASGAKMTGPPARNIGLGGMADTSGKSFRRQPALGNGHRAGEAGAAKEQGGTKGLKILS